MPLRIRTFDILSTIKMS